MKLEVGMLVAPNELNWYVVAEIEYVRNTVYLNCICDHANNIYRFSIDEIKYWWNLDDFDKSHSNDKLRKRGIPHDVVIDAIRGKFDGRFWEMES